MKRSESLIAAGVVAAALWVSHLMPSATAQFQPPSGGGGTASIPGTYTDVSTPAAPASGKTSIYTKSGTFCAVNPSGVETCTSAASNPVPSLTWDNQNGATVSDISGTEQVCAGASGGTLNARYTSAPATPYNLTVQMAINPTGEGNARQFSTNLFFRESSTGKYVGLGLNVNSSGGTFISIDNFTSATVYSSSPFSSTSVVWNPLITWSTPSFIYLRERDDGTNISFYYSLDGFNFFQISTNLSRTAFMAGGPNQIAYAVAQSTAGAAVCATVLQWVTP